MEAVSCPYCGEVNHTSTPEVLAECAYCAHRFAEIRDEFETRIILDGSDAEAWDKAERLTVFWQENGELEKEVIVDRRLSDDGYDGADRRRYPNSYIRRQMATRA